VIDIDFDYSKVEGSTELHNEFKSKFMVSVGEYFPLVTIIPYDVAFVRAMSQPEVMFQVGRKGVPDTIAFGCGWYEFFDMKTGSARLTKKQRDFQTQIRANNNGRDRVHKLTTIREGLEIIKYNEKEIGRSSRVN